MTPEELKEAFESFNRNGLPDGAVTVEDIGYEKCEICSEGLDYAVCHPIGVPHEDCV